MAEILAVRAFAALSELQPIASTSVILLRAIEWSVVNGAKVLNMSFAGPRDPALLAMIAAAQKRNAVVVAAAGNGGSTAPAAYPAAYPGVIAVTAVDAADKRYVHANRGKYIAISAPGVDILAPADGGRQPSCRAPRLQPHTSAASWPCCWSAAAASRRKTRSPRCPTTPWTSVPQVATKISGSAAPTPSRRCRRSQNANNQAAGIRCCPTPAFRQKGNRLLRCLPVSFEPCVPKPRPICRNAWGVPTRKEASHENSLYRSNLCSCWFCGHHPTRHGLRRTATNRSGSRATRSARSRPLNCRSKPSRAMSLAKPPRAAKSH